MPTMTWLQAMNQAVSEEMERDPSIFVLGEDIEMATFGLTAGLKDTFGSERVRNTPISEPAIVGAAVGAAMCGFRPFVDLNIATFSYVAFDQIVNQVAKNRYLFGGQATLPLVIHLVEFHRSYTAAQHTDRPHGIFMSMPGLKIIAPSTPYDAKGLLKAAIRDDDPVLVFGDMTLWNVRGEVPEEDYELEIGKANVVRKGADATIIPIFGMKDSLAAAEELAAEGIEVEILDLRSLAPLDEEAIVESVGRTGRLLVTDTAHHTMSAASEIAAIASERCFGSLRAPVTRLCTPDIHIPFSRAVERDFFPDKTGIAESIRSLVQYQ